MALIAPSILSADISCLLEAVQKAEEAGADLFHIDIMDGHFVPDLSFGPSLVASLKEKTSLPLDVHLMVENPRFFIPLFHEAGADWISIHLEASAHLHKDISLIKEFNRKAGLALNPATPIHLMSEIIKDLDFVLLMSVNPGWGGQKFLESCLLKVRHLKSWAKGLNPQLMIEVDGGVNLENMEGLIREGVDVLVAGSAIFNDPNPASVILEMKQKIQNMVST